MLGLNVAVILATCAYMVAAVPQGPVINNGSPALPAVQPAPAVLPMGANTPGGGAPATPATPPQSTAAPDAKPGLLAILLPKNGATASQCQSTEWFWEAKSVCLPTGGPQNAPLPPPDRECPARWYYQQDSCVPRTREAAKKEIKCPEDHDWKKDMFYCTPEKSMWKSLLNFSGLSGPSN